MLPFFGLSVRLLIINTVSLGLDLPLLRLHLYPHLLHHQQTASMDGEGFLLLLSAMWQLGAFPVLSILSPSIRHQRLVQSPGPLSHLVAALAPAFLWNRPRQVVCLPLALPLTDLVRGYFLGTFSSSLLCIRLLYVPLLRFMLSATHHSTLLSGARSL